MSDLALLNPEVDSQLARKLIDVVKEVRGQQELKLLKRELSHEEYLKTFSRLQGFNEALEYMETEYRRAVLK